MKYFIDGNSTDRYGTYMSWKVVDENKQMLCTFFGPMSRLAALSFCRDLNKNTLDNVSNPHYDLDDHISVTS